MTVEPPPVDPGASAPAWYMSISGAQQGPVSLASLQNLARTGKLSRDDLIWKEGMAEWTSAGQLPGLFSAAPPESARVTPSSSGVAGMQNAAARAIAPIDKILSEMSSPKKFRKVARASGITSAVLLVASISLYFFGFSWFTGALLFGVLWILGEGVAAILHSLERLAALVSQHASEPPKGD